VAYPTDYRTLGDSRDFLPSLDASRSMRNLDSAAHEWIGLFGYWLTGKTDALFPAPDPEPFVSTHLPGTRTAQTSSPRP
jgi:hypothetical protein